MRLSGKTAIVSGASQGIGRALALALAEEGAKVVVSARQLDKLETLAAEIEQKGSRAIPVRCDATNTADILKVAEAAEEFGGADILCNIAQGAMSYRELADCDEDFMHLAYNSGTLASFTFMKACLPHMKKNGGKIINCCSAAGMGAAGFGAYAVAKEGIRALTRTAAKEWGRYKINVNCFMPLAKGEGWGSANDSSGASMEEMVTATVPLGFLATPAQVAKTALFLALPESDYITGMTLAIDGGQYMIV